MSELSGTPIPASIASAFDALKDKPDDVRKLGVELATKLCEDLLEAGVPGLHFYTMNTSTATQEIFAQIKDKKRS
jgi:methylenetetrahydrofolate reductase (NADPH)